MKDLLLYIARNLVDHPDQVSVTEVQGDGELTPYDVTGRGKLKIPHWVLFTF